MDRRYVITEDKMCLHSRVLSTIAPDGLKFTDEIRNVLILDDKAMANYFLAKCRLIDKNKEQHTNMSILCITQAD